MSLSDCIICDIDGTLADLSHRLHYIKNGNRDWDSFFNEISNDLLIEETALLVRALNTYGIPIILCSGRQEKYRKVTSEWLNKNNVPWEEMYMRTDGDFRRDDIIKRQLLDGIYEDGWNPLLVIDDRQRVVDMWREEGIRCYQCAPGDFDIHKINPGKLILLVGPSGAGKTWYANDNFLPSQIVSSDILREELCGHFKDQSKNDEVFRALHSIVEARIKNGLLTVIDTTNLRNSDRREILQLVPIDTKIEYHVLNRTMEAKILEGGWRNDIIIKGLTLIEKHEQIFNSNLKDILSGDNDPRVTVKDLRK